MRIQLVDTPCQQILQVLDHNFPNCHPNHFWLKKSGTTTIWQLPYQDPNQSLDSQKIHKLISDAAVGLHFIWSTRLCIGGNQSTLLVYSLLVKIKVSQNIFNTVQEYLSDDNKDIGLIPDCSPHSPIPDEHNSMWRHAEGFFN